MTKLSNLFLKNISLKQTIFKNISWLMFGNGCSKLFKLILIIVITRQLGVTNYGNLTYIIALTALFFNFSDLGLNIILNREYQNHSYDKKALINNIFIIKLGLITVLLISAIGFGQISSIQFKLPFYIFSIMHVIDCIKTFLVEIARANYKSEWEALTFIVETGLTTLLCIILLQLDNTIISAALAYCISSLIALFVILFLTKNHWPKIKLISFTLQKKIIKQLPAIFTLVLLSTGLLLSDTLMIQWLLGPKQLGLYQASIKLIEFLFIFSTIISLVIFPFISKYNKEINRVEKIIQESIRIILILICPIIIISFYYGPLIINLLFGYDFIQSLTPFNILLITIIPTSIQILLQRSLIALKKDKENIIIAGIPIIFNICFNLLLIPKFGIIGAAYATVISRILQCVIFIIYIKQHINIRSLFLADVIKVTIPTLLIVGVFYLIKPIFLATFIALLGYTIIVSMLNKDIKQKIIEILQ